MDCWLLFYIAKVMYRVKQVPRGICPPTQFNWNHILQVTPVLHMFLMELKRITLQTWHPGGCSKQNRRFTDYSLKIATVFRVKLCYVNVMPLQNTCSLKPIHHIFNMSLDSCWKFCIYVCVSVKIISVYTSDLEIVKLRAHVLLAIYYNNYNTISIIDNWMCKEVWIC